MKTAAIRLIQQCLTNEGWLSEAPDGRLGPKTHGAVKSALLKRGTTLPAGWQEWPESRRAVAYLQLLCRERNIDAGEVDGWWGPQTDYAYATLAALLTSGEMPPLWRDDTQLLTNPHNWPEQNEAALNAFFGPVGTQQTKLLLPYPHRIAWNLRQTVTSFSCNSRVHDSALKVLTKTFDHYGMERIRDLRLDRWGGCLNVRRMRGGSKWSMHAWGIAIDYDPERNQLTWGRERAAFSRPEYAAWWRFWEEEGWVSLGRSKNYDWMHVQAARL